MSPFHFNCSQCGEALLDFNFEEYAKLRFNLSANKRQSFIDFVIEKIGGKCPKCGHVLRNPLVNVEVKAIREKAKK